MTRDIPKGRTKEEIKAREQLIKEFYAQWIAEHPDKKILNVALGKYICVKFLSINETYPIKTWYNIALLFLRNSYKTKPSTPKSDGSYGWGSKRPEGHKGCHPFCEFP